MKSQRTIRFRSYLALALVVLKAKPYAVGVADYVHCVRKHLCRPRNGREGQTLVQPEQSTVWQELLETSQHENLVLKHRIAELETVLLRHDRAGSNVSMAGDRKRKHPSTPTQSQANIQSKRARLNGDFHHNDPSHVEDMNHLGPYSYTSRELVLESLSRLSRLKFHTFKHHERINIIEAACHIMIYILENASNASSGSSGDRRRGSDAMSLQEACLATQHIWTSLIEVSSGLAHEKLSTHSLGIFQTAAPGLLQCLLDKLDTICLTEAQRRIDREDDRSIKHKANSKSSKRKDPEEMQEFEQNCLKICTTIKILTDPFSHNQRQHIPIRDGLACILLDRIGSSMSIQLFVDSMSGKIVNGLAVPRGLLDAAGLDHKVVLGATQVAAPYLTYCLRAMTLDMGLDRDVLRETAGDPCRTWLREKMQNTLLQGIFSYEDDTFTNAMQRPAEFEAKTKVQLELMLKRDESSGNWLFEEVWRQLGWDILMRDQACANVENTRDSPNQQ